MSLLTRLYTLPARLMALAAERSADRLRSPESEAAARAVADRVLFWRSIEDTEQRLTAMKVFGASRYVEPRRAGGRQAGVTRRGRAAHGA